MIRAGSFPRPTSRTVLVHYHLFKNGGTSIERMLRDAFGKSWASWDKPEPGARISGAEMQAWLEARPRVRAVSSHQLVPPEPVGDFRVIPIVFLRHPLLRVRSAWRFEWQKQPGLESPQGSLIEYVHDRLARSDVNVVANFQVSRLGNTDYHETRRRVHRHDEHRLAAACRFVDSLPFVGLVDRFGESLELLQAASREAFPGFTAREHRENALESSDASVEERLERLREDLGDELFDELGVRNRLDLQLYSYAEGRFGAMLEGRRESAASGGRAGIARLPAAATR